ncbi:MAG: lytic transglycosylase domain-containing protein [Treponema sp.]|nr:lytic transglycosylase domain-containing protein [Treponema sp.]
MDPAALVKRTALTLTFLLFLSTLSCSTKSPGQLKFGADSDYFLGLQKIKEGNEKDARAALKRCIKKGSYYPAKKAAEALCSLGDLQEQNQGALDLITKYKEKDSLLIAVKQLQSTGEKGKIVELTQNLNFEEDKDELIRIRLESLKAIKSERYEREVYEWFTSCKISSIHYQFYRDIYQHPDFELSPLETEDTENQENYTPQQFAINYRIELYKRNYTYTFAQAQKIIEYIRDGSLEASPLLASDIGKSYLYGSMDFVKNAEYFNSLAQEFNNTRMAHYFYFYAGRLYDKADFYFTQAQKAFEAAIESSATEEQKDNAIWYLINSSQKVSVSLIIKNIEKYCSEWTDPDYFDDTFEMLISSLLASGNWNAFYDIYTKVDGYASNEVVAQFAYIYARLSEEGLAQGNQEIIKAAYKRALDADSSFYYKVMACYRLGLNSQEVEGVLTKPYKRNYKADEDDEEKIQSAKNLLEGYAYFGFPELIYPTWQELYKKGLPEETYFYLADFLQKVADNSDDKGYYTQALRIASRGQSISKRPLTLEELKLVYPKDFSDLIEKYSGIYEINPNIIYALIRSESFFDPEVSSTAGAVGLSQLMEFTAGDMAKKLKLKEYSLTDPEDSIKIGGYYLAELIRRCDNNELLAFCSYNAGITKVRRWVKSSLIGFGKKNTMPLDLFLETVPYSETRGYGKKLISAAAMYEYLESPENFTSIVKDLMKD